MTYHMVTLTRKIDITILVKSEKIHSEDLLDQYLTDNPAITNALFSTGLNLYTCLMAPRTQHRIDWISKHQFENDEKTPSFKLELDGIKRL